MKLRKDNNKIGGVHRCCHNIVSAMHPSHFREKTTGAIFSILDSANSPIFYQISLIQKFFPAENRRQRMKILGKQICLMFRYSPSPTAQD
jgi:hypothetical protein